MFVRSFRSPTSVGKKRSNAPTVLGKRVGEELKIPVYLYEKAAKDPGSFDLSVIRSGEYEGFFEK